MLCLIRVYRDIKASFHRSAASNKDRPLFPRLNRGSCSSIPFTFPDMLCLIRVYRDIKASVHRSAASNKERPWFPRINRLSTARQPVIVFLDPVYIGFDTFVPAKRRLGCLFRTSHSSRQCRPSLPSRPFSPSRPSRQMDVRVLDSTGYQLVINR